MKILIDTNCLLVSIPVASEFRWLYNAMKRGEFTITTTTDILAEYEEQIAAFYAPNVADIVLRVLLNPTLNRSRFILNGILSFQITMIINLQTVQLPAMQIILSPMTDILKF